MMLRALVALILALTATACASSTQSRTGVVDIAPGVTLTLPERPPFGQSVKVVQLGQAAYKDRATAFQAVITADADQMTLIMTLPSGPRVMRFTWTPGALKTDRESIAPKDLSADHMLADILVMYAPAEFLQQAITGAVLVAGPDGSRTILRDGKALIEVTRPSDGAGNLWLGRALLENRAFGYRLSIESRPLAG